MSTLRNVVRLARAGYSTERLRGALIGLLLLAPAMAATVVAAALHASVGPSVLILGLWTAILGALGHLVVKLRGILFVEAVRIADERGICERCLYPRVPGTTTCPECGLKNARR